MVNLDYDIVDTHFVTAYNHISYLVDVGARLDVIHATYGSEMSVWNIAGTHVEQAWMRAE